MSDAMFAKWLRSLIKLLFVMFCGKTFLTDSSKSLNKLFLLFSGIISNWVFLTGRLFVNSIEFPIWILHEGDKLSLPTPAISILGINEEF